MVVGFYPLGVSHTVDMVVGFYPLGFSHTVVKFLIFFDMFNGTNRVFD